MRALVFILIFALAFLGVVALLGTEAENHRQYFAVGLCMGALLWLVLKYGRFKLPFFDKWFK
jgi:hypothetical protein